MICLATVVGFLVSGCAVKNSSNIEAVAPYDDVRIAKGNGSPQGEDAIYYILAAELAGQRGQSLAQMALAWVLRQPAITSALIGASKVSQIEDNLGAIKNLAFRSDELTAIDSILV